MNNNYTDITILLDKSGSMDGLTDETIIGYNKYVADNLEIPGECRITLVQFANGRLTSYTAMNAKEVPKLTRESYKADGYSTALIDAFVETIDETGKRLAALPEKDKPGKVIFVTITDGIENSSHRYNKSVLKERITHQNKQYNWQFVYMGANQDAIAEASSYGISGNKAMTYGATGQGVLANYMSNSSLTRKMRMAAADEDLNTLGFTQADRAANLAPATT